MLLWLGSGERHRFRTADFIYHYLALKQAFLAYMQHFDPEVQPNPELGGDYGRWTAQAIQILEKADHLSHVANVTASQIQRLNAAGITTLISLAESTLTHVPRIDNAVFARLKEQAQLQAASVGADQPAYRILTPDQPAQRCGLAILPPASLLIPDEYVSARVIENAVRDIAQTWKEENRLPSALDDFLLRRPPRLQLQSPTDDGELIDPNEDLSLAVLRLVESLDHSTLCLQGPPGSGKTTLGAGMILALLDRGKRVGITANSHAAIFNLMCKCKELRQGRLECLKIGGPAEDRFFELCPEATHVQRVRDVISRLEQFRLLGGTAWAFSDPGLRGKLDYLFVDEAGQMSVANLMGMAAATENIALCGDQMRLGQPVQGAHPGESGLSILEYLLQGKATIPPDMGVFLATTWRLHPEICHFLSDAIYEGRLHAAPQTTRRRVCLPQMGGRIITREAGLVFVPVPHEGNTQASDEEVQAVRAVVSELLGRDITDTTGQRLRPLQLSDILCVAPYNMQVRKLQAALGPDARVGTVDKFQGQEAPVVILSMCASQGDTSPRGIDFLFQRIASTSPSHAPRVWPSLSPARLWLGPAVRPWPTWNRSICFVE